jgi:hypothetical protein
MEQAMPAATIKSTGQYVDLTGRRFGRLVVLYRAGSFVYLGKNGQRRYTSNPAWKCRCDCGRARHVAGNALMTGRTISCGCLRAETVAAMNIANRKHGHASGGRVSPEHYVWSGMIQRCTNPNCESYENYGARGIKVCERWRNSFVDFFADMGLRPCPEGNTVHPAILSIERIDNDGDCRWATSSEQARNRRRRTTPHHPAGGSKE